MYLSEVPPTELKKKRLKKKVSQSEGSILAHCMKLMWKPDGYGDDIVWSDEPAASIPSYIKNFTIKLRDYTSTANPTC